MRGLVDTNILLRIAEPSHAMHRLTLDALDVLHARGAVLHVVPQVLYEFWSVATRPPGAYGGLGLPTARVVAELARTRSIFALLPDTPDVLPAWEALVVAHDVKGKASHDARIAAAMRVHGVSHLLTFNGGDFARFPHVTVLAPADVVRGAT
ncbi:MAG TPA: type II toxin-antitoxin system VapC family toxin [Tepidisphaeraceae bacterium]|nr:type II toxin-antitoxin system VapC family toxin [Tepidisphaeraceae bacterium]